MTFTYDPTLSTDLSMVRFQINDTVENNGPRPTVTATPVDPSTSNFADEEITAILDSVGGDVAKAVATFFQVLATQWTKYATMIQVGPYREELYRVATQYQKKADEAAKTSGLSSSTFSSGVIRRAGVTDTRFIT